MKLSVLRARFVESASLETLAKLKGIDSATVNDDETPQPEESLADAIYRDPSIRADLERQEAEQQEATA